MILLLSVALPAKLVGYDIKQTTNYNVETIIWIGLSSYITAMNHYFKWCKITTVTIMTKTPSFVLQTCFWVIQKGITCLFVSNSSCNRLQFPLCCHQIIVIPVHVIPNRENRRDSYRLLTFLSSGFLGRMMTSGSRKTKWSVSTLIWGRGSIKYSCQ